MLRCAVALLLASSASSQTAPAADPRAIVISATRAVEGDSAARFQARWLNELKRDPQSRPALLGLATLNRLKYDYPAAESGYGKIIATGRDRYAVYAQLGLAAGYETRSLGVKGRAALDAALIGARAVGDRIAEAHALVWLAFSRGRLEGVNVAEALLDSASHLIPDDRLELRAALRNRNAIVFAIYGKGSEASLMADSSILLAQRARMLTAEADGYRVLGQVLQHRNQWDSAFVALHKSEELYLRAHNKSALSTSLIWHAQVLGSQGRYGEMRAVMQRAVAEGEATHNPAAMADAQRAFGVLAEITGDWPAAAAFLRQSVAISMASGDSSGVRTTQKYLLGVALQAGDIATARRIAQDDYDLAVRTNDGRGRNERAITLASIADLEGNFELGDKLLVEARAALAMLPGAAYKVWTMHAEARHAIAKGNLPEAERLLEQFLQGAAGAIGYTTRFDARVRLADVHRRMGDIARAERDLATATEEIDTWRSQLGDAELRTTAFQTVATVDAASFEPDAMASYAARVVAAVATAGRAEAAFGLAERWRAREMMDRLTRAAGLRADGPTTTSAGSLSSAPARAARDIMSAIPDDRTALLEFVSSRNAPVTVFVIQRGKVDARVLGPADSIEQNITRFRALIESGSDAAKVGRTLGATLIDPLAEVIDKRVTRVIVVPDGPLHRLPFDALRLADGKYMVERYAVGFAPSASVVEALWARRATGPAPAPVHLLALADPTVPGAPRGTVRDANTAVFYAAAQAAGGLTRLKGAAREARLVARYAPQADVRVGKDASAAFLKQTDLRRYDVLHFATHAIVDEKSVAGTALALAPTPGQSGFVGAGDLAALKISADLVVLSACSSAGGVINANEGVQGLTSALLQAGARSLIATGWRIRDQDVVPLVDSFYSALSRGMPVIDALRDAKLREFRNGAPVRVWGAFIAVGDPLVTLQLKQPEAWWRKYTAKK